MPPCVYIKLVYFTAYRRSTLCIHKAWPCSHCLIPHCIAPKTLASPRKVLNSASLSLATKAVPMKRYSRKGHPALVPIFSSVLALPASEEAGPMVRPASVSAEVVSTCSHGRLVFPSCSHPPSPRLPLLSPSPSTTTLAPVASVVPSPPPLPVRSTSPHCRLHGLLYSFWPTS